MPRAYLTFQQSTREFNDKVTPAAKTLDHCDSQFMMRIIDNWPNFFM